MASAYELDRAIRARTPGEEPARHDALPTPPAPAQLLALQRSAGNHAVGGMLARKYADLPVNATVNPGLATRVTRYNSSPLLAGIMDDAELKKQRERDSSVLNSLAEVVADIEPPADEASQTYLATLANEINDHL